jgi:hypothetical protein
MRRLGSNEIDGDQRISALRRFRHHILWQLESSSIGKDMESLLSSILGIYGVYVVLKENSLLQASTIERSIGVGLVIT